MRLTDALFNWLQIFIVAKERPHDQSAQKTVRFFADILREDHQVEQLEAEKDGNQYRVTFKQEGVAKEHAFLAEVAEKLYREIQSDVRYQQSFED